MPVNDQIYGTEERHQRYSQDTSIALDEVISKSKLVVSQEVWEGVTNVPVSTPVKDLPTRVFTLAASLLENANRSSTVMLSRLSKLALDRAISGRKEEAYFHKVLSTRSEELQRTYDTHMYFIRVLTQIRRTLADLFEKPSVDAVQVDEASERGFNRKLFLDWEDDDALEPEAPKNENLELVAPPSKFWPIIHEYMNDVNEIRAFLKQVWASYSAKEVSLLVVFTLNHVATRMIEEQTTKFLKTNKKELDSCPEDVATFYHAFGVIGAIHLAFEEHYRVIHAEANGFGRNEFEILARIGVDQFFAPTCAKVVEYRHAKLLVRETRDLNPLPPLLEQLEYNNSITDFGIPLTVQNAEVLEADKDTALYTAAWYERTGHTILREYSRMATLDFLIGKPRLPIRDRLTELLSSSLLDPKIDPNATEDEKNTVKQKNEDEQKENDLLIGVLLHISADLQANLGEDARRPLQDAQQIASLVPASFDGYDVATAQQLVQSDPMVIIKNFGKKILKSLQRRDPALGSIEAHMKTPPVEALKLYNPALSGRLAFTMIDGQLASAIRVEKDSPNSLAFLWLYIGLKVTGWLSLDYADAELMISWYVEQGLFGPDGRPKSVEEIIDCINRLHTTESEAPSFPKSDVENLVSDFVLEDTSESWEKLQNSLIALAQSSKIGKKDDGEEALSGEMDIEAEDTYDGGQTQAHASSSTANEPTPAKQPTINPGKKVQKTIQKRKGKGRNKGKAKAIERKLESERIEQEKQNRPRDTALLAALRTKLLAQGQARMYFNLALFRNRITPVLQRTADLCQEHDYALRDRRSGNSTDARHSVYVFLRLLMAKSHIGDVIARELVRMLEQIIETDGRTEWDFAERLCGVLGENTGGD
ncbi:uncharacterized protein K460DRAFT_11289 [Cucurbitaria berberidis CBS 394.84]|uniref:DUF6604 domain-containing protein n=1 Tax=Cucurbitaria berberidis CBS 394.84 TaxID=1168544 RepID=A0A9P4LCM4_9PLEO|nr:uncharacterized protein K460DRAFT_11289 [Cucurbitaria berberidis CBS 394.84]KAF1850145.1 hypothetical protein K460DRAFT_11289 [Cucurbitaria berberidis CBS 394.84]